MHRPRLKVVRRLGTPLPGLTRKSAERKPHPPGAHGVKPARRRPSEYRRRLEEKQKVRFNYGITERQLRGYLERARTEPGRREMRCSRCSNGDSTTSYSGWALRPPSPRHVSSWSMGTCALGRPL